MIGVRNKLNLKIIIAAHASAGTASSRLVQYRVRKGPSRFAGRRMWRPILC